MVARANLYTPELAARICEAVATSQKGLRKTLEDDPELPAFGTVWQWIQHRAEFATAYAQARRTQIQAMAEDIVDLSNDETLDPNDKRIRIETRKWLLSKLIPRTYGDKLDVTSDGQALAVPSHQVDARIQSIIMQAQLRKASDALPLSAEALKLLD